MRRLFASRAAARAQEPTFVDTGVLVRNSLTGDGALTPLLVRDPNRVTMYTCGPTVYDCAHLGHARAYVGLDIARRVLERRGGVRLVTAMNVTDVDDKLIRRAAALGEPPLVVARREEREFFRQLDRLNVLRPHCVPRASEHVPHITDFVGRLVAAGFAYEAPGGGGSVYFDSERLFAGGPQYRPLDGSRVARRDEDGDGGEGGDWRAAGKRHAADFALWKGADPADGGGEGSLTFPSPWGEGRPGWHIECSAMARHVFGDALDVHAGGVDLKWPHHENERMQCHAAGMRDWPTTFLHAGHLHIAGRKMSKSLKNFVSVAEYLGDDPGEAARKADRFRWFCLQARLDSALEWAGDRERDAEAALAGLGKCIAALDAVGGDDDGGPWSEGEARAVEAQTAWRRDSDAAYRRFFDTPAALASLHQFQAACNTYSARPGASPSLCRNLVADLREFCDLTGLQTVGAGGAAQGNGADAAAAAAAAAFADVRARVRAAALAAPDEGTRAELFAACDDMREILENDLGAVVRDGKAKKQ